jgi:demethylmenaquinone methyltransferase/2-methoxy-6-polyprenyl-1,4-benzoquinol methylase
LFDFHEMKGSRDRATSVRNMFGAIADRYDFLNHFLSANMDRRWRRICVREIKKRLQVSHPGILDVGCGTGDLALAFSQLGTVAGCDFCHPMLRLGQKKIARNGCHSRVVLLEADALSLPFANAAFDVVVSAFVLRNLADVDRGLSEMRRVLRPGGLLGILEFGMPRLSLLAGLYRLYFFRLLPKIGKLLSGVEGPYAYLPDSVQAFPPAEKLAKKVERAGFTQVEHKLLSSGVAVLLMGKAGAD